MLQNLLTNAVEASDGETAVEINTDRSPAGISVEVINSGRTIDPGDLPNLFDPFFTKNKSSGTGLGLAVVKKIVDELGGKITVTSGSKVTSFRFTLAESNGTPSASSASLPMDQAKDPIGL